MLLIPFAGLGEDCEDFLYIIYLQLNIYSLYVVASI